jgi:hypothetical protein
MSKRWFAYVGDHIHFNPLRLTMKPNRQRATVHYLATWKSNRHFGYDPYNSVDAVQGFWRAMNDKNLADEDEKKSERSI